MNKKSHEQFIAELLIRNSHYQNGEFEVVGEYKSNKTPIACKCPTHGIWESTTPISFLTHNTGCPRCSGSGKIFTHGQFIQMLEEKNTHFKSGEFIVLGEFVDAKTPILCECVEHGKWNTTNPSHLLYRNASCPLCAINHKVTHDDFLNELIEKNEHYRNGEFTIIGEYSSRKKVIKCNCKIHAGWETSAASLLMGSGCPKCVGAGTSFAENYMRCALQQALPDANIPDRGDRSLLGGREIDIPVYAYGIAIEYGAWYWHKSKWKEDYGKQKLLADEGINLYTLYDGFDDAIEFPDDFNVYTYEYNLGEEKDWPTLRRIIDDLLKELVHQDIDWKIVEERGLMLSRATDTERFIDELIKENVAFANGDFEITGKYIGARVPIECKCKVHGVWKSATPDKLLQGRGCPKCSRENQTDKQRYTLTDFSVKLAKVNPKFASGEYKVVGKYVDSRTPVDCECIAHGVWKTSIPTSLLKGHGCPKCGVEKSRKAQKKYDTKSFLQELYIRNEKYKNGEFEVTGEYINSHTPIECKCKTHGTWKSSTPINLLRRNQGCPYCYRRGYKD